MTTRPPGMNSWVRLQAGWHDLAVYRYLDLAGFLVVLDLAVLEGRYE